MPRNIPLDKLAFVLSLAFFVWLHGFVTSARGWFPNDVLVRAWHQAKAVSPLHRPSSPDFVAPRVYARHGTIVLDSSRVQPGLTLVTSSWNEEGWRPGVRLIDGGGRVWHEWRIDPPSVFPDSADRTGIGLDQLDIQGTHLLDDGGVIVNVEYAGVARLDACSRVAWSLPAGNHHSIARADDGSFWIPGLTSARRRGSPSYPEGHPGIRHAVYQDVVMRVSADGEVLEEINLLDVLYDNGLARTVLSARRPDSREVTHLNDIEPLPDSLADEYPLFEAGDLLVSMKYLRLVLVFDPTSGVVKWHTSDGLLGQHDPDFLGDGWIGVFDNAIDGTDRGTVLGGSRVVAFQPHTDSTRTLFAPTEGLPFFTRVRGKWQELPNGNLLLTESAAGRLLEITARGDVAWEWVVEPYSDTGVPFVSDGVRTDLTPDRVRGWPCSPLDRQTEPAED